MEPCEGPTHTRIVTDFDGTAFVADAVSENTVGDIAIGSEGDGFNDRDGDDADEQQAESSEEKDGERGRSSNHGGQKAVGDEARSTSHALEVEDGRYKLSSTVRKK